MNDEEMREAEAKEVDYCLNAMKPCRFWAQPDVMGALFHCPFCGPITESRFDPERAHIWDAPPRLVALLKWVLRTEEQVIGFLAQSEGRRHE